MLSLVDFLESSLLCFTIDWNYVYDDAPSAEESRILPLVGLCFEANSDKSNIGVIIHKKSLHNVDRFQTRHK